MLNPLVSYGSKTSVNYQNTLWRGYFQNIVKDNYSFDECLKHDGTTSVFVSSFDQQRFIVKRYNTKNKWHIFRRFLQTSRAKNCFKMAKQYSNAQLLTPEPIGFVQERFLFFKLRSWYICRYQEGTLLSDFLDDKSINTELNAAIVSVFNGLANLKLSHGDMKATNLIVDTSNKLYLIDLDAARVHRQRATWLKAITKDWNRLLQNWPIGSATYQSLRISKDHFFNNT